MNNRPGLRPDFLSLTARNNERPSEHTVPSADIHISNKKFVQKFMSNKLVLSQDPPTEYTFGIDDLENAGEIGRGRFGTVSKMNHIPTNYPMAVKRVRLVSNQYDDRDDEIRMKQLSQEIQMIQEASTCEEVVRFFGVTFHEGDCLICMEYMDLSCDRLYKIVHRLARQPFSEDVLGCIGVTVLKALDNLKKLKHIIHRDVKPSNILLNLKGQIKLCDFGISGYLEDSLAKTKDIGCRPYMAPERLSASLDGYDIRSDVWSLGITLVETVRGTFPYPHFSELPLFAQIKKVVMDDPPTLTPQDNYSQHTIHFINICLTKEYTDRPNYSALMETEFFRHFSSIPRNAIVADYVREMLQLRLQFPDHPLD